MLSKISQSEIDKHCMIPLIRDTHSGPGGRGTTYLGAQPAPGTFACAPVKLTSFVESSKER